MRESSSKGKTVFFPQRARICFQRCKLVRLDGRGEGQEHEVSRGALVVGSSPDCDIFIDNRTVSRRHFSVSYDDQSYVLRDLGSTNGTYVDEYRVKEVYLRPGAVIEAGEASFRFELVSEPADLEPSERDSFGSLLGHSTVMRAVFAALEKVAPTDATVLLYGETGTGKGATARAIHDASRRKNAPFVVFDCGATAPALVESELFGHEAGAFTGALTERRGVLAEAFGGTLFIDELADLPWNLQPKLLRALEEREYARLGSTKPLTLDCRIIASTQRDLWEEVLAGRFRRDLYFRVAVVTIPLPPLKHRRQDIKPLVTQFLKKYGDGTSRVFEDLSEEVQQQLLNYDWPGNIRELRNVVERLCVMEESDVLWAGAGGGVGIPVAPSLGRPTSDSVVSAAKGEEFRVSVDHGLPFKEAKSEVVNAFEKQYLTRLLDRTGGNISQAAREAGVNRRHLYTLLSRHGLMTE